MRACLLDSAACVAPGVVQEASKSFVKTRASSSSNLTGHRAMATGVKIFTRVHYLFPENQKCAALVRLRMSCERAGRRAFAIVWGPLGLCRGGEQRARLFSSISLFRSWKQCSSNVFLYLHCVSCWRVRSTSVHGCCVCAVVGVWTSERSSSASHWSSCVFNAPTTTSSVRRGTWTIRCWRSCKITSRTRRFSTRVRAGTMPRWLEGTRVVG